MDSIHPPDRFTFPSFQPTTHPFPDAAIACLPPDSSPSIDYILPLSPAPPRHSSSVAGLITQRFNLTRWTFPDSQAYPLFSGYSILPRRRVHMRLIARVRWQCHHRFGGDWCCRYAHVGSQIQRDVI